MKKFIFAALIAVTFSMMIMAASVSQASTYFAYGVWYGNVCRFGAYYQIVPYMPVGSGCYMPGWNLYGQITAE